MKQEYIVIEKQNEWLNDLIGKSVNQKLICDALEKLYDKHRLICRPGIAKCIVTVSDTLTKEILGIGGSSILENIKTGKKIADLTNQNFGLYVDSMIRNVADANKNSNWTRRSLGVFNVRVINVSGSSASMFNETDNASFPVGTRFQFGSGVTPPTVTDADIETKFGTAPENDAFDTGGAPFDNATFRISPSASIVAGGAGTINESAWHFFSTGSQVSPDTRRSYLWFHDSISPGIPFIATQTLTASYLLQF